MLGRLSVKNIVGEDPFDVGREVKKFIENEEYKSIFVYGGEGKGFVCSIVYDNQKPRKPNPNIEVPGGPKR